MKPREVSKVDRELWGGTKIVFRCPPGFTNCDPVEVLRGNDSSGAPVIRVPWRPDEIDVAALANGATVWLTIWGNGMPPVDVQVINERELLQAASEGSSDGPVDDDNHDGPGGGGPAS